jgi:hypothetical protein
MAYLLTHYWPGGTEEQYRATLAAAGEAPRSLTRSDCEVTDLRLGVALPSPAQPPHVTL